MTKIQAVVFDLDGTLLDSLADIANASNAVLESHGFPAHPVDDYRWYVGDGVRRLIQRVVPESVRVDESAINQWRREFLEQYHGNWNIESHLYEGVPDMLDGLAQRRIAMAILSNKPQEVTSICVAHYLPDYPFTAVLGQQTDRPPKPDLTGVTEVMELLDVPPAACFFLGDTAVDMETARGAGMTPVGVSWGFRPVSELRQAGALAVIDHPVDLLKIVDRWPPRSTTSILV